MRSQKKGLSFYKVLGFCFMPVLSISKMFCFKRYCFLIGLTSPKNGLEYKSVADFLNQQCGVAIHKKFKSLKYFYHISIYDLFT